MRLDHVSYCAERDGLRATAARLGEALGVRPVEGGLHPRFGTRNVVLPLARGHYLEVVEPLDHPASDKAPFGQAVRARCEAGGGWLGWVVAVDDIAPVEERLGRPAVPGNRRRPDGVELRWRQIGVLGLLNDPQLPFVVRWDVTPDLHPSAAATDRAPRLVHLQIAGNPQRVTDWLGDDVARALDDVRVEWTAPRGTPGLVRACFDTGAGELVRV